LAVWVKDGLERRLSAETFLGVLGVFGSWWWAVQLFRTFVPNHGWGLTKRVHSHEQILLVSRRGPFAPPQRVQVESQVESN